MFSETSPSTTRINVTFPSYGLAQSYFGDNLLTSFLAKGTNLLLCSVCERVIFCRETFIESTYLINNVSTYWANSCISWDTNVVTAVVEADKVGDCNEAYWRLLDWHVHFFFPAVSKLYGPLLIVLQLIEIKSCCLTLEWTFASFNLTFRFQVMY